MKYIVCMVLVIGSATLQSMGLLRSLCGIKRDSAAYALRRAIKEGEVKRVKRLLPEIDNLDKQLGFFMPPPLFLAIDHDNKKICEALLKAGATLENRYNGVTPLIYAARKHKTQLCILFIQRGARTYFKKNTDGAAFLSHLLICLNWKGIDKDIVCPICRTEIYAIAKTQSKMLSFTDKCCQQFICMACKEAWATVKNVCPFCRFVGFAGALPTKREVTVEEFVAVLMASQ